MLLSFLTRFISEFQTSESSLIRRSLTSSAQNLPWSGGQLPSIYTLTVIKDQHRETWQIPHYARCRHCLATLMALRRRRWPRRLWTHLTRSANRTGGTRSRTANGLPKRLQSGHNTNIVTEFPLAWWSAWRKDRMHPSLPQDSLLSPL